MGSLKAPDRESGFPQEEIASQPPAEVVSIPISGEGRYETGKFGAALSLPIMRRRLTPSRQTGEVAGSP